MHNTNFSVNFSLLWISLLLFVVCSNNVARHCRQSDVFRRHTCFDDIKIISLLFLTVFFNNKEKLNVFQTDYYFYIAG